MIYFKKYIIRFCFFLLSFLIIVGAAIAAEATVNFSLMIDSGELTLTSPSVVVFNGVIASDSSQNTNGVISLNVINQRGTNAGWTVSMTSSNFTRMSDVKTLVGNNSTVDFIGTYDGLDGVIDPLGKFVVEITQAGTVGTAVFKWTDPLGNETMGVLTNTTVSLSNGVSVTFGNTNYVVGDKWIVLVDVLPYTGLTVDIQSISVNEGSSTGVTSGVSAVLSGTSVSSGPLTLMQASRFNGFGDYSQLLIFSLVVHGNILPGLFTASSTITIV